MAFALSLKNSWNNADIKNQISNLLKIVGLSGKEKQIVNSLSGGEKQRIAISRAIANNPKIILADEPTGSLDERNTHEIFKLLKNLSKDRLVIVVTHDEKPL